MFKHQPNSHLKIQHIHLIHDIFYACSFTTKIHIVKVDINLAHP